MYFVDIILVLYECHSLFYPFDLKKPTAILLPIANIMLQLLSEFFTCSNNCFLKFDFLSACK